MPLSKLISGWCWDYFNKYGIAPNTDIQDIYKEKSERLDPDIKQAIEGILQNLSDEFENGKKLNYKWMLDKSEEYMQSRNLESLSLEINTLLKNGQVKKAETLVTTFKQIKKPDTKGLDLFRDRKIIADILSNKENQVLFRFKGEAGKIFPPICLEEFIAFFGPQKRGKSWALQEVGKQALLRGFNVAHFNFEMPEIELLGRYVQSLTGSPLKEEDEDCLIPVFDCEINQLGKCKRAKELGINAIALKDEGEKLRIDKIPKGYKPCAICKDADEKKYKMRYAQALFYRRNTNPVLTQGSIIQKITNLKPYIRGGSLRWVTWPSDTKTINDIRHQLAQWEDEDNFQPHVIITDYADLMVADEKTGIYRLDVDNVWKGHKRLSQEYHCAVFTGSQTESKTHEQRIKQSSASEDKNKIAHVDRGIALEQTEEDYNNDIMRWAMMVERRGKKIMRDLVILQQLKLGNPFLDCYVEYTKPAQKERKKKKR